MKKEILTSIKKIQKDDMVLVLGVPLFFDELLQEQLVKNEVKTIYLNPIDYKSQKINFAQYIKYEVGSEEGISALLLSYFAKDVSQNIQEYIEDLDIGYLSAETSIGEEEFEDIVEQSNDANNTYLILSDDFLNHKNSDNIIKLLGALNKFSKLNLVIDGKNSEKIELINKYSNEKLEEIEELDSFNGLVICKNHSIPKHQLIGGISFSKVAKIEDGDEIVINFKDQTIKKEFKIEQDLKGTIALCNIEEILAYSYTQVKIEKVS